ERIAALDAAAIESGVAIVMLMEVAGWQVARCAWRMLGRRPARVLVVAGRGNNGGDGLVAARHLRAWGCAVDAVVLGEEQRLRGAVVEQLRAARGAGVAVAVTEDTAGLAAAAANSALCVDAVLGTGLRSAPQEPDAGAIAALEGARVLSVDVPSGLDSGTGRAHVPCVRAQVTCTLTAVKSGLWTAEGRERSRCHSGQMEGAGRDARPRAAMSRPAGAFLPWWPRSPGPCGDESRPSRHRRGRRRLGGAGAAGDRGPAASQPGASDPGGD